MLRAFGYCYGGVAAAEHMRSDSEAPRYWARRWMVFHSSYSVGRGYLAFGADAAPWRAGDEPFWGCAHDEPLMLSFVIGFEWCRGFSLHHFFVTVFLRKLGASSVWRVKECNHACVFTLWQAAGFYILFAALRIVYFCFCRIGHFADVV